MNAETEENLTEDPKSTVKRYAEQVIKLRMLIDKQRLVLNLYNVMHESCIKAMLASAELLNFEKENKL